MSASVKRPYRSPLREAQAASTRLAVLQAAGRLFVERGYVGTSVDAIAEAAGVSRATVFAAGGTKPALLKAAYDVALVGDDEPIPFPERPRSKAVRAEPDPHRYLELYAGVVIEPLGRLAGIYEAVRGAASGDPEVRAVWEKIQQERRIGGRNVVADVVARAPLRSGLDPTAAADIVWVLNDPGVYHLLVERQGWAPEAYAAWLGRTLCEQLLGLEASTA